MATLSNSPYGNTVPIPKVFSFAERTVLLSAASGKEIKQSFYNLEPGWLKSIFEPALYAAIWSQQQRLVAGDTTAYDTFGASLAISGDYALVGGIW